MNNGSVATYTVCRTVGQDFVCKTHVYAWVWWVAAGLIVLGVSVLFRVGVEVRFKRIFGIKEFEEQYGAYPAPLSNLLDLEDHTDEQWFEGDIRYSKCVKYNRAIAECSRCGEANRTWSLSIHPLSDEAFDVLRRQVAHHTHLTEAEQAGSRRQAVADALRKAEPYLPLRGRRDDIPSMWLFLADVAIEAYESVGKS